jgi:hypothetical protein
MNETDEGKGPRNTPAVVNCDSLEVAQNVIKSMRSLRLGKKNYSQLDSIFLVSTNDLNSVIKKESTTYNSEIRKKQNIEDLLTASLQIPQQPQQSSPVRAPVIQSKTRQIQNDDDDHFLSSDEDDDSPKKGPRSHHQKKNIKPVAPVRNTSNQDDQEDLDLLQDDDDGDLFHGFVPPSSNNKSKSNRKNNELSSSISSNSSQILGDNGNSQGSGLAKKGITIKPGQAIRVNPVRKDKKS